LAANRLVLLAAVPLFLILAISATITYQFAANERDAQSLVRHTYEVMEAQRRLQDDVQTAETGLRGFLLSRDPAFQRGYQSYAARIPGDLKAFRDLVRDNPPQLARADRMEKLLAQRMTGLETAVRQNTDAVARAPEALQGLTRGRLQMAAIRAETTAGLAEEARLLTERDAARMKTERLEIAFAAGAAITTLALLLLAAAQLVRNNLRLTRSEAARANEAAILQATLDNLREGIAFFASDGLLCSFNRQFFRLLDLPDSLANSHARLPAFQQIEAGHGTAIFAPPAEGEPLHQARRVSLDERELEIYKAQVSTGGFLIGVKDVTDRVRAEAVARQAQKMESIGQLTGGVAHDFNNLLQIISANLDLAVASGEARGDSVLARRLQNAMGAVSRGARLTGQLLAFARRQALSPRSVDLGRTIRDMGDMLRRTLGEQIQVESVIAGGLWSTLADPSQVENAILNLAINARDAMPEGGRLTLEVANAHLDDAYAASHVDVTPGQYVMLAVSDTGTGMGPGVMARVFEPFFTTKPEGKGTGLGLAQVYGFVKQSGGHVKIYSELGEGTTVKLYLPRTRRERDAPDPTGSPSVERGNERILVVEDDDGVRAAVVDMLTDLGYSVLRAENAQEALKLLEGGAKADLLFTDVVMPGPVQTRELARRAQEICPGLLLLYTSGYTQNAIVHNGRLDEDALLLSKPYRRDELARKLRGIFNAGRGAPEPAADKPVEWRGKVLVVEDVALIRMATMDMIEQIGLEALEAGDAIEALALLQNHPEVDILLTDLGLPGMNGHQLVDEARKLNPALKVIIASGYSAGGEDRPARPDIAKLVKPYDMSQLRKALGL
jgi:signal transduction histidine kinase/DNA-binding response OmpR family regulator/CHASE3 domain sensor protein